MDLFDSLTAAQREAVEHLDGPLLVLAGPGSGKTRVVTHRIANLLAHGVSPGQVLALTFTNKAAEEMRARLQRLSTDKPVWVGTFHRFCARLLRQYAAAVGLEPNFAIYDTADSGQTLRRVMNELSLESSHVTPDQVAGAISWAKNNLITAADYRSRLGSTLGVFASQAYPAYQAALLRSNAADFDDLLLHVATLLRENPEIRAALDSRFRYILVDEYQDTNLAQYTIARALSIDYPNLAVTGDPDQSIYGWRGANLNNILNFEGDYPQVRVVRLERNYRSTKRILRAAGQLIRHNQRRKAKDLYTENDEGQPVRLAAYANQKSEAEAIAVRIASAVQGGRRRARDFAIFYRNNALSRSLEHALREQGLRYQMVHGVEFYQRKEIKEVVSYLALLNNPRDDAAFLRVVNTPPRGIGASSLQKLIEAAGSRKLSLLAAARESGLIESLPGRSAVAIARFVALYDRLSLLAARPVEEILGHVLSQTGYREALEKSTAEEDQQRLANIEELLTAARQFDEQNPGEGHLEEFLEQVCLVNDTDDWEAASDCVTLMTLHASKGLEFPVVFIIALEEGILPHKRGDEYADLEEERRLLFVGMTRAQEELHLSRAQYRAYRGRQGMTVISPFLRELPGEELDRMEEPYCPPDQDYVNQGHADQDHPDEIDQSEPPAAARRSSPSAREPAPMRLTTAAALFEGAPKTASAVVPDAFYLGMAVLHPEYGLGKVMALSGSGTRRSATVNFASSAGQKTFVLAQSPLVPAKA